MKNIFYTFLFICSFSYGQNYYYSVNNSSGEIPALTDNLRRDYDALVPASIITDGNGVITWEDQGSDGADVDRFSTFLGPQTGTDGGGYPYVDFEGSGDHLFVNNALMDAAAAAGGMTMVLVQNSGSQADARPVSEGNTTQNNTTYGPIATPQPAGIKNRAYIRNSVNSTHLDNTSTGDLYDDTKKVITVIDIGTNLKIWSGSTLLVDEDYTRSGAMNCNVFILGALRRLTYSSVWVGLMYEVLVYDVAKSDTDRATILSEMETKWGI